MGCGQTACTLTIPDCPHDFAEPLDGVSVQGAGARERRVKRLAHGRRHGCGRRVTGGTAAWCDVVGRGAKDSAQRHHRTPPYTGAPNGPWKLSSAAHAHAHATRRGDGTGRPMRTLARLCAAIETGANPRGMAGRGLRPGPGRWCGAHQLAPTWPQRREPARAPPGAGDALGQREVVLRRHDRRRPAGAV